MFHVTRRGSFAHRTGFMRPMTSRGALFCPQVRSVRQKVVFASTRGAAKWLFWTSSGWKPTTVALDRHEFRFGKTEVRLFLAPERLFRAHQTATSIDFRGWWTHLQRNRAQLQVARPHICNFCSETQRICIAHSGHKVAEVTTRAAHGAIFEPVRSPKG